MENELEKNAILGAGRPNKEIRRKELELDTQKAKREAFGDTEEKKTLEELNFEYFQNAMESIRQRGKEMQARTKFSQDLIRKISKELEIDERLIKIYRTIGTALDEFHRISAWIELSRPTDRKLFFVTLDIFTEERNKRDRADVVFRMPKKGFNEDNEEYQVTLEDVVERIVAKLKKLGIDNKKEKKPDSEKKRVDWSKPDKRRKIVFFKENNE